VGGIGTKHQCFLLFAVPDELLRNVALNKTSFQISTYVDRFGEHSAGLANDGSRQTDFSVRENGCAASNPANYPWWAVDLDVPTLVYQVTFTNRGDAAGNNTSLAYFVVSLLFAYLCFTFIFIIFVFIVFV